MPTVVLGITGSVAAYRAADLARDLMRAGFTVRACLTEGAQEFVQPALFEALTGQPVLQSAFDEPEPGRMAHIDWARQADLLLIAPATAHTLNRLAAGIADDMLTTIALVYDGPVVVAPAMNPSMLAHPATQASLQTLQERGVVVVDPVGGLVACGEEGQGKLAANETILQTALAAAQRGEALAGQRVLITSGPTQEAIDDVRYLSNRSSGRMGAALAQAALMQGAEVTVVSGPTAISLPGRARVIRVKSALEMQAAVLAEAPTAHWVVGAAAVADYRPVQRLSGKRRRDGDRWTLELEPNPDIIASVAAVAPDALRVAFAAESGEDLDYVRQKAARKGVHAIAMNDVSQPGIGFESEFNALSLITPGGVETSGHRPKLGCAQWLWERLLAHHQEGRLRAGLAGEVRD